MSSLGSQLKLYMQTLADALDTSVHDTVKDQVRAPVLASEVDGIIARYGFGTPSPKGSYPVGYPINLFGLGFDFEGKQPGAAYEANTFLDFLLKAMTYVLGGTAAAVARVTTNSTIVDPTFDGQVGFASVSKDEGTGFLTLTLSQAYDNSGYFAHGYLLAALGITQVESQFSGSFSLSFRDRATGSALSINDRTVHVACIGMQRAA